MKAISPEVGLERLLLALETDLLVVADEEILAIAKELGMNPAMKGSAAMFGITTPTAGQVHRQRLIRKEPVSSFKRRPKEDTPPST